ncbi:MAG: TfoX/Sxy family protein [Candidatus Peribacteria bacterium]|nr:MAG: TfoX/Sxy family protein [Candidatus Peribacteria bacterium]
MFGIFVHDVIYFKVGDNNKHFFEERGSRPFTYQKKGEKSYSMRYMELPEAIMENREELELWIERSIEVKTGKRK